MTGFVIAVAGGAGAMGRYWLEAAVQERVAGTRPWGTAAVNTLGAAALGVLVGLQAGGGVPVRLVQVAGTGFLGGFTTFSTWMVESVRVTEEGSRAGLVAGLVNVFGLLAVGMIAAALGLRLGRAL